MTDEQLAIVEECVSWMQCEECDMELDNAEDGCACPCHTFV